MAQIATEHAETTAAHANPAPLGLSAFALTTFVFSIVNTGLIPASDTSFLGLAFAFGGLAQLLAGIWEFRAGNTLSATTFVSFSAFWFSFGFGILTKTFSGAGASYYFLAWTILTLVFLLSALKTNLALIAFLFFLALTFLALTIGTFAGSDTWHVIGGWLGVVTAIVATYTALSGLLGSVKSAFSLPTFPVN